MICPMSQVNVTHTLKKAVPEFPSWLRGNESLRMQVQSLASLSGLRIWHCRGVGQKLQLRFAWKSPHASNASPRLNAISLPLVAGDHTAKPFHPGTPASTLPQTKYLGLSVLNGQFHCNSQTLPITSCLGDVITNLFWRLQKEKCILTLCPKSTQSENLPSPSRVAGPKNAACLTRQAEVRFV